MTERATRYTRGFALFIVLWSLVLISAIGLYLIANARAETAIAHNVRAAASAEALADAGIARAAFNAMDPNPASRWKTNGTPYQVVLASGVAEIRLEDETTKINPNQASDALLAALIQITGTERMRARHLGAAIADWVSPGAQPRAFGAKLDQYRAAGRTYGPPNAPVQSLDELQLVLGMTPQIFAAVRPYLSIYTEGDQPQLAGAAPAIVNAVALAARNSETDGTDLQSNGNDPQSTGDDSQSDAAGSQSNGSAAGKSNAGQTKSDDERIYTVQSIAHGSDGGVFVRRAVIKLDASDPRGYAVLEWRRGDLDESGS